MKPEHWIIILLTALVIYLWTDGCNNPNNTAPTQDTVRVEITKRYDHYIYTHSSDTIYLLKETLVLQPVQDTLALIRDYFTQREFSDTILDSNLSATYSGMVWKNSIFNPKLSYKLLRPQTIIQNTVIESTPTRKLSLGAFAGYSDKPMIGALAVYTDRRDRSFSVGYGINQTLLIGITGKIKLRK